MIGDIADRTPGADKDAILAAIGADERVGPRCLRAGYGFGGPCFPRDNRALGSYARSVGVTPHVPEATDASNKEHAANMAEAMLASGAEGYTIGDVAFKPRCPVDVIEESQPLEVAKILARRGRAVTIEDRPGIIELVRRTYGRLFSYVETGDPAGGGGAKAEPNTTMGNPGSSYNR